MACPGELVGLSLRNVEGCRQIRVVIPIVIVRTSEFCRTVVGLVAVNSEGMFAGSVERELTGSNDGIVVRGQSDIRSLTSEGEITTSGMEHDLTTLITKSLGIVNDADGQFCAVGGCRIGDGSRESVSIRGTGDLQWFSTKLRRVAVNVSVTANLS